MKKLIVLVLIVSLVLPLGVQAASIGGAETQGQGKFSIGLDNEFVFDRDGKSYTEVITDGTITENWPIKTEIDRMYRTMVKAGYGLLDNLDVYVRLGAANPDYKEKVNGTWTDSAEVPPEDKGTFTGRVNYKGDNAFAYGFGMKGAYPLENDWFLGCDVQYLRHKNDYKASASLTVYDDNGTQIYDEPGEWKGEITFYEWHIAPYVARKINNFTPYLGIRYSDARLKDKDEDGDVSKVKADDNFGVFLGIDYKIDDSWMVNFETRFIDETALSFGGTYRF
jgi:outer membrane protein W